MCGIIGAVAQRDILPILLQGLKQLEYRGYDSAGIALINNEGDLQRFRAVGNVDRLQSSIDQTALTGGTGIAHTRWATHGKPSIKNAHPHVVRDRLALVHNGIIENHAPLRRQLRQSGYVFSSSTDSEVVAAQIHYCMDEDAQHLLDAVRATTTQLTGTYAIAVICQDEPDRMVVTRRGSPLIIGIGIGEHFVASDVLAISAVAQKFIFLEDGDIADIYRDKLVIYDSAGKVVQRAIRTTDVSIESTDKLGYRHYMLKEIFEQPQAIINTLKGCTVNGAILEEAFGHRAWQIFDQVECVKIIACGTSYHAGLVAQYWLEELSGLPCTVEVASEFRYRKTVIQARSLLVCISQSGETADTLAALREVKDKNFLASLAICNVAESSLTREADLVLLTRAGPEIGVASTKSFTTQLIGLFLLVLALAKSHNRLEEARIMALLTQLEALPGQIEQALKSLTTPIKKIAENFTHKHHALYLGRGSLLPIAMEGALKLKEISYIHAEAYPAGELKHGPLALVDDDMPIIVVAPHNQLFEKITSNLQEVKARGGVVYLFSDQLMEADRSTSLTRVHMASVEHALSPILYVIPLQLLAYYIAMLKGADIDQPRNLAKSVTVE